MKTKETIKAPRIITAYELHKEEIEQSKKNWARQMRGRTPIKLTKFQKEVLRDAIIRGYFNVKHIDDYYSHRASSSMALRRLLEAGIVEEGKKKKTFQVKKKFIDADAIWLNEEMGK